MTPAVYTIGHSTHSIEELIGMLKQHSIDAVGDVRSQPYSRMNPQFDREAFKEALNAAGIKYVFLGNELGARSQDKSCYRNGQVQYNLLAQTALFKKGIERIKQGADAHRIALMCAEKEPLDCHRTILVSRKLVEEGVSVKHILGDGRVEDHQQAMQRLLSKLRIPAEDFFRSTDEIMNEAYERQANEIAYREQAPETPARDGLLQDGVPGAAE